MGKTWIDTVHGNYIKFEQLEYWDKMYNLVERLGYSSAKSLWLDNPLVGGGENSEDFGIPTIEELVDMILPYYKQAIFFTEDVNSEYEWNGAEFSIEAETKMFGDIRVFIECIENIRDVLEKSGMDFELFAHDFWLTRNNHGAGFWDSPEIWGEYGDALTEIAHRQGELCAYVQDGLIYFE